MTGLTTCLPATLFNIKQILNLKIDIFFKKNKPLIQVSENQILSFCSSDQAVEMGGIDSRRASEVGDHLTLETTTDVSTHRRKKKKKAASTGETRPPLLWI